MTGQFTATMVYVTHDQVEAMTLADQIVVMNLLPGKAIGREGIGSVGIRPEHINLDDLSGDWPAEVLVMENLGSDTAAYVKADELGLMTVRLSGHRRLATLSRVFLTPEAEHIHLFEADGLRL